MNEIKPKKKGMIYMDILSTKIFAAVLLAVLIVFPLRTAIIKAKRVTCDQFKYQDDAQDLFMTDIKKYKYLDGDKDGKVCDKLPKRPPQI